MIYTIEELEIIRNAMGERMKNLKNRIKHFELQDSLSEEKRKKYIGDTESEYGKIALIEAKAMREISKSIIKS